MGCNFCKRKRLTNSPEEINHTIDDEITAYKDNFDELKAREFVKYLLSSDMKIYKNQLYDVLTLNSEEFKKLFNGESDYIYTVKYPEHFKKLALKFENFSLLLNEWYQKDKRYLECLKYLWYNFVQIHTLKDLEDDELEKRLSFQCSVGKKYKNWDEDIKNEFKIAINNSSDLSEKLKIFINMEYKELDDVLEAVLKTKKSMVKNEEKQRIKNKNITENLDKIANKTIEYLIPIFFDKLNVKKNEKEENGSEKNGKDKKEKIKLTKNKTTQLIQSVAKMYIKGEIPEDFDSKKTLTEIGDLVKNFDNIKLFKNTSEVMNLVDNKFIAYGILGLSYVNLCYNIITTYNFIENSRTEITKLDQRLEQIIEDYNMHYQEISILPNDVEEAQKKIEEIGLKFKEDQSNLKKLIFDIENEIINQNKEKNRGFFKIFSNLGLMSLNALLAKSKSNSNSKVEYGISAIFNGLSAATDATALTIITKNIAELKKLLSKAKKEKENIEKGLDELKVKYRKYQQKIAPAGLLD